MPPKVKPEDTTPDFPQQDPFMSLKQLMQALDARMTDLEGQMINLQETWNRILNIAQEPPLRPYNPIDYRFYPPNALPQQQQQQQQYQPPQQQVQQPVVPEQPAPKWEKEKEKPKGKKLGKGTLLILAAITILALVFLYLKSQGYSITIPGIG